MLGPGAIEVDTGADISSALFFSFPSFTVER